MAQLDLLGTMSESLPAPTSMALPPFLPRNDPMRHPTPDSSPKAEGAYKTISEVSEELDVPTHVLRFWESRFPQVKPQRMRGGRRYYRPHDIDVLKKIKTLLYSQGYTIRGAKKHVKDKTHEIHFEAFKEEVIVHVAAPATPATTMSRELAVSNHAPPPRRKALPPELAVLLRELRELRTKLLAFH